MLIPCSLVFLQLIAFGLAIRDDNQCNADRVPHIVSFGRTGSGKSWIGNHLTASGTFVTKYGLESETTRVSTAKAWNNDLFADVPGYFDSEGRDQIQQAAFVDFIRGATIRSILFVFTDRLDYFAQKALEAFALSGLKDNIILVCNKDISGRTGIEDYKGFPVVFVQVNQPNLDSLKSLIASKNPVKATGTITPTSLFKHPLKITRTEQIREYVKDEIEPRLEKVTTTREEMVNKRWQGKRKWYGRAGTWYDNWVKETITDTKEIMVDKLFKVYHVHRVTYAERFDGKEDILKKEFVEAIKEPG